jgi:hypothetical protein
MFRKALGKPPARDLRERNTQAEPRWPPNAWQHPLRPPSMAFLPAAPHCTGDPELSSEPVTQTLTSTTIGTWSLKADPHQSSYVPTVNS